MLEEIKLVFVVSFCIIGTGALMLVISGLENQK